MLIKDGLPIEDLVRYTGLEGGIPMSDEKWRRPSHWDYEPWKQLKVRKGVHERLDKLRKNDFKGSSWYSSEATFSEAIDILIKFYDAHKPKVEEEVEG